MMDLPDLNKYYSDRHGVSIEIIPNMSSLGTLDMLGDIIVNGHRFDVSKALSQYDYIDGIDDLISLLVEEVKNDN